eukprot:TRINITY_DN518_c0_g1_i1.p1 TRINITY_DN518_c0_g1~~TRINITY_DN518_c0_g1_i1.p1  ORF type:complete len:105 (-),score=31.14 TRINITY_DN518_c0_g1_i1:114-428(-)
MPKSPSRRKKTLQLQQLIKEQQEHSKIQQQLAQDLARVSGELRSLKDKLTPKKPNPPVVVSSLSTSTTTAAATTSKGKNSFTVKWQSVDPDRTHHTLHFIFCLW